MMLILKASTKLVLDNNDHLLTNICHPVLGRCRAKEEEAIVLSTRLSSEWACSLPFLGRALSDKA